ncbi:ATP-binding protein [Lacipirellula parvula]|uniref:Chromosome segregation protein SMC-like n=1 Tax=Lacipirellula parvula TaxID=2650471 RepID=A0A5K7XDG4_9BACT|nr:ATP-binding protein [Lacipirellula parvula]BBO31069.1 chromosome segregation protein SMC-like [Lacipirellula parvula]
MTLNSRLSFAPPSDRGYRLHKLEVLNWGTFDGQVFTVRPAGQSALLIGQNGSGKSTLVDALLTLLVRPGVRNFNVASGAKKRERDEKSYLRGAFDRGSDESGEGIEVKFLRPSGDQYAVILAWFSNADTGKSFSIAQILYLNGDQSVEKIYCLADGERSIQADFGELTSGDKILRSLRERGLKATRTFHEFEGWFARLTHVKPKAMEVFNQTVAVKDIQKLNDFIRDHMLEHMNWDEKVDRLLGHFAELSDAHESLVRVRQQRDLLNPIALAAIEYQEHAARLERAEGVLAAIDLYFSQKTVALFAPVVEACRQELVRTRAAKAELTSQLVASIERIRQLKNEIDHAGGDRLRQIPRLIEIEQLQSSSKRLAHDRFAASLITLGITQTIDSEIKFTTVAKRLPVLAAKISDEISEGAVDHAQAILKRGELRKSIAEVQQEFEGLQQRRDNVPQWCVAVRSSLCTQLGLIAKELPFAAELISIHETEREWEASIEKVLRGFALSMLVPERHYQVVAQHLDRSRLTHDGRGQRLVYLRVVHHDQESKGATSRPTSLLRKLVLRQGHPLVPWVAGELSHRFDYECCDGIETFRGYRGLALTIHRHVKSSHSRHEKDDREQALDPRNFVLGWDNREKKLRLAQEISRLTQEEVNAEQAVVAIENRLDDLRLRANATTEAMRLTAFAEIDYPLHALEIAALEKERQAIEGKSSRVKLLKGRLEKAELDDASLQERRDGAVARERELDNEIAGGEKLLAKAEADLRTQAASGDLERHAQWFSTIDAELMLPPLTSNDLFQRRDGFRASQDMTMIQLRKAIAPVLGRLVDAMSKYLRHSPESTNNLHASVEYLESFLGLKRTIEEDDLPRHERRFKDRLNQKVIEEIGLFRNALEQERRGIEDKIELLNVSLKKLPYRPGTHIQLEPRAIRDPEIVDFQRKLRECIEGSFEDSAEANESRFVRIQELVEQLRDDGNRRWRDKVTDVRRWFDFLAIVVDRDTLKTVSIYQDSSGQSGGEKAKLAFTILVAAIAFQYDLDPEHPVSDRFHFVVVDEMFSKVDDQYAEYALDLFKQFGLQLLIVAPLDAKARITQPYVGNYLHVVKQGNRSAIFEMTAREFEQSMLGEHDLGITSEFTEA